MINLTGGYDVVSQFNFSLAPRPKGFHLITQEILKDIGKLPDFGLMHVFILHTSAALSVNENADPTVRHDLDKAFDHLAPESQPFYQHTLEGADDMPAHIKAVLTGSSITIPITKGKLNLGTWQGIYLCEFRESPSARKIVVTLLS
jgi:secondary thiamine-phosphate synthase enzyme